MPNFTTYLVGGAVRDHLLGVPSNDRDFVMVGATPQELEAQGFKQVGNTFPVYLHPETGDEYALARKEKKVAPGYAGFSVEFGPEVTLEEDLARRDLTINAMAMTENLKLIDPYHGYDDLKAGILRHVGPAFSEDPLRVLRVARFVARYNFTVAPETFDLCQKLVWSGELNELSPDRFWKEIGRMLEEPHFEEGLLFLKLIDAIGSVPYLYKLFNGDSVALTTTLKKGQRASLSTVKSRNLTSVERAFFDTAIETMSFKMLEELRVPNGMVDWVVMYKSFEDLHSEYLTRGSNLRTKLVEFVDRRRSQMKVSFGVDSGFRDELVRYAHLYSNKSREDLCFLLFKTADAIYSYNFEEFVSGLPKDKIRNKVKEQKLELVTEVLWDVTMSKKP